MPKTKKIKPEVNNREREFRIHGAVSGSKFIGTYVAKSAKEALEKAEHNGDVSSSVCHNCSSEIEDPEIHRVYVEDVETGEEVELET